MSRSRKGDEDALLRKDALLDLPRQSGGDGKRGVHALSAKRPSQRKKVPSNHGGVANGKKKNPSIPQES